MTERIFVPNNPTVLEIIPDFSDMQYFLAFGSDSKKFSQEKLIQMGADIGKHNPTKAVAVISRLFQMGRITKPEGILFIFNISLDSSDRKKGYAKKALDYLFDVIKRNASQYEYMLCNAVSSSGEKFFKDYGFENIISNFWGKKIH